MQDNDRFDIAAIRKLINEGQAKYETVYDAQGKVIAMVVRDLLGEVIYYADVKAEDRDKPDFFGDDVINRI